MITKQFNRLRGDSLVRNSFYLMLATALVSAFGFVFWVVNAHLFSPEEVGLATALISVVSLVALLSQIGINTVFVRFLSKSDSSNNDINTGIIFVGGTALFLGVSFVLTVQYISPKLIFVQTFDHGVVFALYCLFTALSLLFESIFLAYRKTEHTLINNSFYSAIKIFLPFAFISLGSLGILSAAAIAQGIGVLLGLVVLMRSFAFRPSLRASSGLLQNSWRYSSVSYSAAIFNLVPVSLIPIIITNELDASATAYYYISMMIGNLLYVIPWSAAKSLFAEGSHDEEHVREHVKKAIRINLLLLIPAIAVTLAFGELALSIFGKSYAAESAHVLWFIAITGVPIAISSIFGALLQIKKDPRSNLVTNIFYGTSLIVATYALLPLGLFGIGLAWFIGSTVSAIVSCLGYYYADKVYARLRNGTYVPRTIFLMNLYSRWQFVKNDFKRKTILFYPHKPAWYHIVYIVMHTAGYKITNDPKSNYDVAFSFEDITVKMEDDILRELKNKTEVINGNCLDISKKHVEEVFSRVFGYETKIDPRTYQGPYVQKSDTNALHDGQVLTKPCEPKPGFIYQRLIDNTTENEGVYDLRVLVIGSNIPTVTKRCRSVHDRFNHTKSVEVCAPNDLLQPDERQLILKFCSEFGVDYGELDILRDNSDGRLYIVDVNLTCGGPVPEKNMPTSIYNKLINTHIKYFNESFLTKK